MSCAKGDYIGFTIGDYHSTQLGIVRVSSGDRYTQNILPTITDKTLQIPGADGTFLFGSFYTQNVIHIDFAFDSATDSQIRLISQVFSSKKPQKLIFDENPYKYYTVKSSGTPQLKYLTFDEYDSNNNLYRAYKGEGSVDLVAYFPYAKHRYKYLSEYTLDSVPEWESEDPNDPDKYINKDEWATASGMASTQGNYDEFKNYESTSNSILYTYNAGDLETDFKLKIVFHEEETEVINGDEYYIFVKSYYKNVPDGTKFDSEETYFIEDGEGGYVQVTEVSTRTGIDPETIIGNTNIFIGNPSSTSADDLLIISNLRPKADTESYVIVNSATNLIEGYNSSNKKSGLIYNDLIESGNFFKIPTGEERFNVTNIQPDYLSLEYNYIYY